MSLAAESKIISKADMMNYHRALGCAYVMAYTLYLFPCKFSDRGENRIE